MARGYTAWMRRNLSSLADFELEANLLRQRRFTAGQRGREDEKLIRLRKELGKRTTFGPDVFSAKYKGPLPTDEGLRALQEKIRERRRARVRARKLAKRQAAAAAGRQVTAA